MSLTIPFLVGGNEEPPPTPPPVTITGVRIPADGTPPHLLSLTTMPSLHDTVDTDAFLFHVPDLRHYWQKGEKGWSLRDKVRLDFLQDHEIPRVLLLRQQTNLRRWLHGNNDDRKTLLHLRQRYLGPQQYFVLKPGRQNCAGAYYLFYTFDMHDLPQNEHVPSWMAAVPRMSMCCGDVFLVKMAPIEHDENGWAVYEDFLPEFLQVLAEGPLDGFGRSF